MKYIFHTNNGLGIATRPNNNHYWTVAVNGSLIAQLYGTVGEMKKEVRYHFPKVKITKVR